VVRIATAKIGFLCLPAIFFSYFFKNLTQFVDNHSFVSSSKSKS
jgi:hypothetical protein